MIPKIKNNLIADDEVLNKIYILRGQKVMLDRDLSKLYGVETKQLKRQVKRNLNRFPTDFMFELSKEEITNWRYHFGTSNSSDKMGLRYAPFCFTEQGVAMLSSVLNSTQAIEVNIQIIRIFTRMRELVLDHKDILLKIEKIEKQSMKNTDDIKLIFQYLKKLLNPPQKTIRKPIGY